MPTSVSSSGAWGFSPCSQQALYVSRRPLIARSLALSGFEQVPFEVESSPTTFGVVASVCASASCGRVTSRRRFRGGRIRERRSGSHSSSWVIAYRFLIEPSDKSSFRRRR